MLRDIVAAFVFVISIGITLIEAQIARAQQTMPRFERISIEQGLSQSIVEGALQDQTGFMWFVTEDGLNRYDGYRFLVKKHVAGDPNSLSHNELKAIHEDSSGKLCGIFTERDLVNKMTEEIKDLAAHTVSEFMTPRPETVRADQLLASALQMMMVGDLRYLPLVDEEGRPTNILSSRDILRYLTSLVEALY